MLAVTFAAYGIRWISEFGASAEDFLLLAGIFTGASLLLTLAVGRMLWLRRTHGWRLADAQRVRTASGTALGELNTWRRRVLAHVVDSVAVAVLALALGAALSRLLDEDARPLLAAYLVLPLAWALYEGSLLLRADEQVGVSLGKQVAHIRVVRTEGGASGATEARTTIEADGISFLPHASSRRDGGHWRWNCGRAEQRASAGQARAPPVI